MRVPTRYEEDEEISRGEGSELDVERSQQSVAVHEPPAGVEQGEGEEGVLQAVDHHQIFVFSLHSHPLRAVVVLTMLGFSVPVSKYLRDHKRGQILQDNSKSFLQIKIRTVHQKSLKDKKNQMTVSLTLLQVFTSESQHHDEMKQRKKTEDYEAVFWADTEEVIPANIRHVFQSLPSNLLLH